MTAGGVENEDDFFLFFLRLLERLGRGETRDGLGSWSSEATCQLCDLGNIMSLSDLVLLFCERETVAAWHPVM